MPMRRSWEQQNTLLPYYRQNVFPSKTYFSNTRPIVVYDKVTLLTLWDSDCLILKLRLLTLNGDKKNTEAKHIFECKS